VWVRAGSTYETEMTQGVNHFVEHLLFAGTTLFPSKKQLTQAVESTGGILNAFSEREGTCYWAQCLAEHFPTAIHVLGELLSHSLFRAEDVESERLAILQELKKHHDYAASWVYALLSETLWPKQSLGRYVGGSENTVRQLSRQEIVEYYQRRYQSHNIVIAVVGNISDEHASHEVQKHFADLPNEMPNRSEAEPIALNVCPTNSPFYSFQVRDLQQLHICLGAQTPGRQHPGRYAFEMINVMLGKGMSSRFFDQIRTKEGFAYSVHTTLSMFRHAGAFTIYTGVSPEHGVATIEAIFREMENLAREGITLETLTHAKEFYKGRVRLGAENAKNYACLLGESFLLDGQVRDILDILTDVDRVTLDDVNTALRDYLRPDRFCVVAIGPLHAADRLIAYLKGLGYHDRNCI